MLKRKIEAYLELWKESKYALLIDGARQVGKTYILRKFVEENFENCIYINLFEDKEFKAVLSQSKNSQDFLLRLSTLVDKPLVPFKTAIFIDEIQELKEFDLVTMIKFLIDKGEYRFLYSGSLLGVELYDVASWPMGYLTHTTMYPLDFEEFLWACGVNQMVIDRAKACFEKREPVEDYIHSKLIDLFAKYLLVGGMPDAVNAFVNTNDLSAVALAHETIEQYNKKDVAKYALAEEKLLIKEIYELIPEELNSKNKRFMMKDIVGWKKGKNITPSFSWLRNAGVAIPVYNTTAPEIPLKINAERQTLKLFHEDVGLLTYILMDPSVKKKILNREKDVNFGSIYENVCAQLMTAHGFDNIYYFNNKKLGEVDFMVEYQGAVLPIEVKSGKSYERHSALNNLLNKNQFEISEAIVFCNSNVRIKENVVYLPIYMVEFLRKRNRYIV